jgi:hypothetical protein
MQLRCSAGHIFNTADISHRVTYGDDRMVVGGQCPMVMEYDRMSGTKYCRRVLREWIPFEKVKG